MKQSLFVAIIVAGFLPGTLASAQHSGGPTGAPRQQCLSNEDLELITKLKALTRATTEKDPPPPFNPDYFVGTWAMEWDAPDTPLAPEGVHSGTLIVKHVDGCFYEGDLTGKGPSGPAYQVKVQMMYDPASEVPDLDRNRQPRLHAVQARHDWGRLGRVFHPLFRDRRIQGGRQDAPSQRQHVSVVARRISASGARFPSTASST